jgi:multiple sugar transport system permease protein
MSSLHENRQHRNTRVAHFADNGLGTILVSPTVLVLVLVIGYPTLAAIAQSFFGAAGVDPATGFVSDSEPFVGLQNYTDIFGPGGARFWNAFANTSFFAFTSVALETVLGVLMALVMNHGLRGRGIVRAAILIPWAIPTVVSALLWRWIFNADGAANALLGTQVLWSADGFAAQASIIIADVWKTAPFIGLLVLAGLQIIPEEVYEAARLDGAGVWRRFVSITLPLVKPALLVAVLFRLLDALRMFDLPYVLVGPRKRSVETLAMLAQDEASNVRYGAAAAYAIILFLYVFAAAFAFVGLLGANVFEDDTKQAKPERRKRSSTDTPVEQDAPAKPDAPAEQAVPEEQKVNA